MLISGKAKFQPCHIQCFASIILYTTIFTHRKVSLVAVDHIVNQAYKDKDCSPVEGILATSSFTEDRSHVCIEIKPIASFSHVYWAFLLILKPAELSSRQKNRWMNEHLCFIAVAFLKSRGIFPHSMERTAWDRFSNFKCILSLMNCSSFIAA